MPQIPHVSDKRPLPAALDLSAYRIVQEAITNVLKHANASRVEVILDYQPDALALTISDNGAGATEKVGESTGHGLIGMRERIARFGGRFSVGPGVNEQGTQVISVVPWPWPEGGGAPLAK